MSLDPRKEFLFATIANYFGVNSNDKAITELQRSKQVDSFLDDGNQSVLVSIFQNGKQVQLYNDLQNNNPDEQCIIFFKLKPEAVTPDNIHHNVLVSSMFQSPASTLYHTIKNIFGPLILNSDVSSKSVDPKLQNLLSELEAGLGSYLRKSGDFHGNNKKNSEQDFSSILTPSDEFQFWSDQANKGDSRATHFKELFERSNFSKDFSNLDPLELVDALELVDISMDILDEVWKQDDHQPYPQNRMIHMFDIFGGAIGRYLQKKFSNVDIWKLKFNAVKERLQYCIQICEKWRYVCQNLTEKFWKTYNAHPWKDGNYIPENLMKLCDRFKEILKIRVIHEQHNQLLSSGERQYLNNNQAFQPFAGLNPVQYNPFTVPLWNAAVAQYNKDIEPTEEKIATKLREKLSVSKAKSFQLLREFQRYKELINRPSIKKALTAERETLIGQLYEYIKGLKSDFQSKSTFSKGEGPPKGHNMPEIINYVMWGRQLEARVKDLLISSESLLSDTGSFDKFKKYCLSLTDEIVIYIKDNYENWVKDTTDNIDNEVLCLKTTGRLMELNHSDGKLEVQYDENLVKLIREVRQFQGLGFNVSTKIQSTSSKAMKFYQQAIILKQVAHFYNTIDKQMVSCQQSIMLDTALTFEKLVKNPNTGSKNKGSNTQVTWDNPKEVENYITKLQIVAEKLTTDNRKLRKCHNMMVEKIVQLMSIDLLRQQSRWKDALMEMRQTITSLTEQGFKLNNMKPWTLYLDHQLYKALEHQYQLGLEALNEHLPEIKVELVFRQQQLQFRPPFEEIRAKYYREIKKFIAIPKNFKGLAENQALFQNIIQNNSHLFQTVYEKAESLFSRLIAVKNQFEDWVVLGSVDIEQLVEEKLHSVGDWEMNIKMIKIKGKEAEKLPLSVKIDCITVSTTPVKSNIDDLLAKLFDYLLISLRGSVVNQYNAIDGFTGKSMDDLHQVPQTIEEMGEVNEKYQSIMKEKPKYKEDFSMIQQKNKLLAQTSGSGVEKIVELTQKWEKLELMLEAHEMMVKGQMETMKKELISRSNGFQQELERFAARWHQLKPANIDADADKKICIQAVNNIKDRRAEFNDIVQRCEKLKADCSHFELDSVEFPLVEELETDIATFETMWKLYEEFNSDLEELSKQDWISFRSQTGKFDDLLGSWVDILKKTEPNVMTLKIQKDVDSYKNLMPVYPAPDNAGTGPPEHQAAE